VPSATLASSFALLNEFLNAGGKRDDKSPPTAGCGPTKDIVEFLIATVPDPLDSHLAQDFDRAVDAIQRSVGSAGYVLDRLYLPWKKDAQTRWTVRLNPPESEDGWLTASPKSIPGDQHRHQPGVLLFRNVVAGTDGARRLLLVFLVGETPTSGLQRDAFVNAVTAVDRFPEGVDCAIRCSVPEIRILGPYFSGTTDSLKNALAATNPGSPIEIVSGSATVPGNQDALGPRFHATVAPDDALESAAYSYFYNVMGVCPEREIAILSEGATIYGASAAQRSEDEAQDSGNEREGSDATSPRSDSQPQGGCKLRPAFRIQFPLHVAQLRAAYEQDSALKNSGVFNRGPRHTLELPLEPPDKDPGDILPPQDSKMSSVFAEMSLAAGIETIRREPIRMVGILATDPRDLLFLARKIGEARANVVLFAFGSDALYAHPDYQRFLRGMLVATSYPLFPPNQEWTGAGEGRVAFSGFADEGVYNATTVLLKEHGSGYQGLLLEYRLPDETRDGRPPIWLTTVGRGGYWPVRYAPVDWAHAGYLATPPRGADEEIPEANHIDPPPGSIVTFVVVELLIAFLAILYVQARRIGAHARLPMAEEMFSPWKDEGSLKVSRTYTACLFTVAFLVQAAVVSWLIGSASFFANGVAFTALTVAAGLFAVALLVCLAVIVVREVEGVRSMFGEKGWRQWEPLLPSIAVTLPVISALLWVLKRQWMMSRDEARAFFARALDLTSGVTPVVPFFLGSVVLALWAVGSLRRAFLLEVQGRPQFMRKQSKSSPQVVPSFRGTLELYADVMDCLDDGATRRLAALVPVFAIIPFYRIAFQSYTTIDGDHWSLLLKLLILAGYFVILYNYTLFVLLWIRLKRLLRRLALHPLSDAFRRLPDSCTASPWKLWSAVPNVTTLAESVALLKVLVRVGQEETAVTPVPTKKDETGTGEKAGVAPAEKVESHSTKKDGDQPDVTLENAPPDRVEADPSRRVGSAPTEETKNALAEKVPRADELLGKTFETATWNVRRWANSQRKLRDVLSQVGATLAPALEAEWQRWPGPRTALPPLKDPDPLLGVPAWLHRETPAANQIWMRAAEELVALRTSAFIRGLFQHLKNLLAYSFLGFLFVFAAISSYPFQPKYSVMTFVWVLVLVSICIDTWIFVEMERDPILSFMGKTEPGKVSMSMDFVKTLGIYIILPLLALAATQFPGVGDFIFSIFNPAMRSLSR
jgi:hypothetical protein